MRDAGWATMREIQISFGNSGPWRCLVAESAGERMRGLLGRTSLDAGSLMLLSPCGSIHTIGMKFAIDAVFLDSRMTVVKSVRSIPPCRIAWGGLRAKSVVEAQAGWLPEIPTGSKISALE